jgi:hypothetical protein
MTDETIVAVYDTSEHAALAVRDLEAAGVPSGAISRHAEGGVTTDSSITGAAPYMRRVSGQACSAASLNMSTIQLSTIAA